VAQLVNYGVFVLTLLAFRFLLYLLIDYTRNGNDSNNDNDNSNERSEAKPTDSAPLPEWMMLLLGYAIFLWVALEVETPWDMTPDLAVLACVCLIAGMLLRLEAAGKLWRFALFGVVLGIGYWTKAILLPLGFAIDLFVVSPERPIHLRRHGQAELCMVRLPANVLEKLAGGGSRQRRSCSSHAAAIEASTTLRVRRPSRRHVSSVD
jgi:hypothetical protein